RSGDACEPAEVDRGDDDRRRGAVGAALRECSGDERTLHARSDEVIAHYKIATVDRAVEIFALGDVEADRVGKARADDLSLQIGDGERLQPRHAAGALAEELAARCIGGGESRARAGDDLKKGASDQDYFAVGAHRLPGQRQCLRVRLRDQIATLVLDVAQVIDEQRCDGDKGKDHQPRANAERALGTRGLRLRPSKQVEHRGCGPRVPLYAKASKDALRNIAKVLWISGA